MFPSDQTFPIIFIHIIMTFFNQNYSKYFRRNVYQGVSLFQLLSIVLTFLRRAFKLQVTGIKIINRIFIIILGLFIFFYQGFAIQVLDRLPSRLVYAVVFPLYQVLYVTFNSPFIQYSFHFVDVFLLYFIIFGSLFIFKFFNCVMTLH